MKTSSNMKILQKLAAAVGFEVKQVVLVTLKVELKEYA